MTSHELARKLLRGPDLPVVLATEGMYFKLLQDEPCTTRLTPVGGLETLFKYDPGSEDRPITHIAL